MSSMGTKVAVVTGSNKGIGLAIVRALCEQFPGDVFLTARNPELGVAAVQQLEKEGFKPKFHQLDVIKPDSVVALRDFLQQTYGGLDVLVNNAGIAFMFQDTSLSPTEQTESIMNINYFGTVETSNILFPLLRPNARVCNMSSGMGKHTLDRLSPALRETFLHPGLKLEELNDLVKAYVKAFQNGTLEAEGFNDDKPYGVSKFFVNILTRIQQREMDKNGASNILINAVTPGFVATDMTAQKGGLTVEQGAETPVYCVLLPAGATEPRGQYLRDKKVSEDMN